MRFPQSDLQVLDGAPPGGVRSLGIAPGGAGLGEGGLGQADRVMERTFWIGVYPGITPQMVQYVVETFDAWLKRI